MHRASRTVPATTLAPCMPRQSRSTRGLPAFRAQPRVPLSTDMVLSSGTTRVSRPSARCSTSSALTLLRTPSRCAGAARVPHVNLGRAAPSKRGGTLHPLLASGVRIEAVPAAPRNCIRLQMLTGHPWHGPAEVGVEDACTARMSSVLRACPPPRQHAALPLGGTCRK